MLHFEDEKMSKSLGNLVLVRDLLRSFSADAIRHYLVSRHYRSEVHFTDEDLARSADAAATLQRAWERAQQLSSADATGGDGTGPHPLVREHRDRFLGAMDEDLDTPSAMSELEALAQLALGSADESLAAQAGWMVHELGGSILGLSLATAPAARPTVAA
jgi:cysteinyl-tRNA synthetase